MQCTVHTGNSLGIGIIEKYVGRYWMFNTSEQQNRNFRELSVHLLPDANEWLTALGSPQPGNEAAILQVVRAR
jgi:hypothetical protein